MPAMMPSTSAKYVVQEWPPVFVPNRHREQMEQASGFSNERRSSSCIYRLLQAECCNASRSELVKKSTRKIAIALIDLSRDHESTAAAAIYFGGYGPATFESVL